MTCMIAIIEMAGLSHSEIHGSKVICTSPQLFAAYHVLLRLNEPRHPPYALSYFLAWMAQGHRPCANTHTFSCISLILSYRHPYPISRKDDGYQVRKPGLLYYSLACVNMSKILSPGNVLWTTLANSGE